MVRLGLLAAALVFFAMIVWGGIRYLNAGGDKENLEAARKTLAGAGIGLVIVVASFAIIQLFYPSVIGSNKTSGTGGTGASTTPPAELVAAENLHQFLLKNATSTLDQGFLINFSQSASGSLHFTAIYFNEAGKNNAKEWLQQNGCENLTVDLKSAAQAAAEAENAIRD